MTLFLVQFVLPAMLGYTLYVGICDRLSLRRPRHPVDRPRWLLGLGTAISVTGVVSATLLLVYGHSLSDSGGLLEPAGLALALALSATLAATGIYRVWLTRPGAGYVSTTPAQVLAAAPLDVAASLDAVHAPDEQALDAQTRWVEVAERCDRMAARLDGMADLSDPARDPQPVADREPARTSIAEPGHGRERELEQEHVREHALQHARDEAREQAVQQAREQWNRKRLVLKRARQRAQDRVRKSARRIEQARELERETGRQELTDLQRALSQERATRERIEGHLRITRKALFVLENEAQGLKRHEDDRAHLEGLIENSVREKASAQARAEREAYAHLSAQTTIAEQREDLLRAQQDLRRNVEARTRALSTATRSLEHAKRSARVRRRLQRELDQARSTISNRQETISSLIRALETEKRRTRDEVTSQAKQLLLHERQLKQRRDLEEVARSVEGRLSSRLVKKIARARPLVDG